MTENEMTDEEIGRILKSNPNEVFTSWEKEDENGREWMECHYDADTRKYVWEWGTQARASDGGYCWEATREVVAEDDEFLAYKRVEQ